MVRYGLKWWSCALTPRGVGALLRFTAVGCLSNKGEFPGNWTMLSVLEAKYPRCTRLGAVLGGACLCRGSLGGPRCRSGGHPLCLSAVPSETNIRVHWSALECVGVHWSGVLVFSVNLVEEVVGRWLFGTA